MNDARPTRASRFAQSAVAVVAAMTALSDLLTIITIAAGRVLAGSGTDGRLPLGRLPQLNQAELREGATGTLADADLSMRLLGAAPSAVNAITVVLAGFFLILIIDQVSQGRPFTRPVLILWRRLTATLLLGGLIQGVVEVAAVVYLTVNSAVTASREVFLGGDYVVLGIDFPRLPVEMLLAGVVTLALGLAFRAGARLEKEVEGVV